MSIFSIFSWSFNDLGCRQNGHLNSALGIDLNNVAMLRNGFVSADSLCVRMLAKVEASGAGALSTSDILFLMSQELQTILLQHGINVDFLSSSKSGWQQISQSPRWLLSGCLNKTSSRLSSARFLHSRLWCSLWSFWHLMLQYRTDLQAVHVFNLMPSFSAMPQEAQHVISSAVIILKNQCREQWRLFGLLKPINKLTGQRAVAAITQWMTLAANTFKKSFSTTLPWTYLYTQYRQSVNYLVHNKEAYSWKRYSGIPGIPRLQTTTKQTGDACGLCGLERRGCLHVGPHSLWEEPFRTVFNRRSRT